jgi:UDP-N-acetylglucosamine--N-acetylmuramyl-(pentapeptide) pyrophosphoryl-undecaprenol N-acetylglucosamine transferase
MRVIISAGGTGGHIYPALAILNKIKEHEPDSEFLYIGTHNRMEKDIVPNKGIPFKSIEIYGFNRQKLLKNFKVLACLIKSKKECKKIIKDFNPDIVIGVGGYVTGPVVCAAQDLGYKTFIHEQNSIPGKSNMFLSKRCDKIGVSFESTLSYFKNGKAVFTGNPCSENAIEIEAASKVEFGLSLSKKLVYIVMGSLGSSKVTEYLISIMPKFEGKNYEVMFVTGKDIYNMVKDLKFPSNVFVLPYIENQSRLLKSVDLMVTRCGASTLSELIALGIPSILIPSPYVANNHQYKNAMDLCSKDAAILLEEKNLISDNLVNLIDETINDEEKLSLMKKNLSQLYVPDSAGKIYKILKELVDNDERKIK